jgi:hypothetical protein
MQIILTEAEYNALKTKQGLCPEAVAAAKQELCRKLTQVVREFRSDSHPLINEMRRAVCQFDEEISAAIKAA